MKKKLVFIIFIILNHFSYSQTKFEKEIRINKELVPEKALVYIDLFKFNKKIKWYQEFSEKGTSIEAKTKFQKEKYSIEFSKDGDLEDIEIIRKWDQLANDITLKIDQSLKEKFTKYSLEKIQIQYTGDSEKLRSFLLHKTNATDITTRYELVIHTKIKQQFKQFELLFSDTGKLLKSSEIISSNSDNIEY